MTARHRVTPTKRIAMEMARDRGAVHYGWRTNPDLGTVAAITARQLVDAGYFANTGGVYRLTDAGRRYLEEHPRRGARRG